MVTAVRKLKDVSSLEEKLWQPRLCFKKQRYHFANKGLYNQSYGFSSSHVWMWKLDYKESWALKNWCFWTVVLEKTLESPLDCKEIKPVNPKGNQPWIFIGRTMLKLKLQYFGHLMWRTDSFGKDHYDGKDSGQEKGEKEEEMVGWYHGLSGHEFEQAVGDRKGQGSLICCSSWGLKELVVT